jgi:hypothetical protein
MQTLDAVNGSSPVVQFSVTTSEAHDRDEFSPDETNALIDRFFSQPDSPL